MSEHAQIQHRITINTLEVMIKHYPANSSVHGQVLHPNLRNELEERTTFFIAQQLHRIRTALSWIVVFLLLSTISIAKVVVGVRLSDQCPDRPQIAIFLIAQGAHVFLLIIAPIILVKFYYSECCDSMAFFFRLSFIFL
jgi:hypothetical protein